MKHINWIDHSTLNDSSKKILYNKQLFSIVAPKYDFITRLMSLGGDQHWKSKLVSWISEKNDSSLFLDIASGTGDIAFEIRKKFPNSSIIASDLSIQMLNISKRMKLLHLKICNDMCALPFSNSSFDIITGSYALRNAPDLNKCLYEINRVLKHNAKAYFLDFSRSDFFLIHLIKYLLLIIWGGFLGLIVHRNPAIYGYIAKSLGSFPNQTQLHQLLNNHGLKVIKEQFCFWGFISIIEVCKV